MGAIKWIFCDVDGCMTSEASVRWDVPGLLKIADYCKRANGDPGLPQITLCTGRPQPYVEALAKLLDIRVPLICENGAVVYTLRDNRARFADEVEQYHLDAIVRLRRMIVASILERFPQAVLQYGKHAQISVFSPDPTIFDALRPEVESAAGGDLHLFDIKPSQYYLNISLRVTNKGRTANALASAAGFSRSQIAAIGDTDGDLSLRESAAFLACPANATDAMKEHADYVSPHPELEGVLDILEKISVL
ncbi:MAG: HAD hydrolase family protein [Candidatus Sumerlaeota bacterium]